PARLRSVGRWRFDAAAVTPALYFATLLLGGTAPALVAVAVSHLGEIWRSGGRRAHPLTHAAIQACGVLAAAVVLDGLAGGRLGAGLPPGALVLAALAYWAVWHLLALPLPWLSGRSERLALGFPEEGLRGLLLLLAGISLVYLWAAGPVALTCGLTSLILLNRAVTSAQFGRETLVEPKTGLFNARYFQDVTEAELQRCRRLERPATVLMCDLDHLREVNNRFGHQTGDLVIRRVAEILRGGTRNFDVPARFGGEEFVVLLPETTQRRARIIAERLRIALAEETFHPLRAGRFGGGSFGVTISIGVATFPDDATTAEQLIARADQAAYAAKSAGRNRVEVYSPASELTVLTGRAD
ncbi:MAG TPA: GGDEF domain-containing protein, partial [Candidatus Dormibacteraeota bacterium]|nr:GGDEF domain-containing protein [Candidatus Dormibacteraeota bacterium]